MTAMFAPSDHGWVAPPLTTLIAPEQVRPGHVIVWLGDTHTITRVEPWTGPTGGIHATAHADNGWAITLIPGNPLEIVGGAQ